MTQSQPMELIALPSLRAHRGPNGGLVLTQKYLDGVEIYADYWPGPVTTLVELEDDANSNMDLVEIDPSNLRTGLELRPKDPEALAQRLASGAVALAHLAPAEAKMAALCHRIGLPIVMVSEYSPKTEKQIVNAGTRNLILRARRKLWIMGAERIRRNTLQNHAAGLQCSGTPTFDLYRSLSPDPLLFFDNRVQADDIISQNDLAAKCAQFTENRPLRLCFGGRLIAMKGVMDLPKIAQDLDALGVPYQLDIYGSGDLEQYLRSQISSLSLSDRVALHPPMDFNTGWIPTLKRDVDVFVCCHPQGDPSSTYPEVMSCGVPIVGYDNEAFAGIVRESGTGWQVPIHDTRAMARQISELHQNRSALQEASVRGRDFARTHCFEETFARRVNHLIELSRLPDAIKQNHAAQS